MLLVFVSCILIPLVLGKVQFMGMNIAGFDFGCQIDGTCPLSSIQPPLSKLGGADGAGQMQHFIDDDQMNIFRFPVSWQFLVNKKLGGTLDATNFGKYDQLMQTCLATSAYCAIDIHNFARYNGGIIGQGGPTDAQFADLWSQLAARYSSNPKAVFGLMNEPHDLDISTWANSVQAAVTAIRNAGATTQMILLPGSNFTSAGAFVTNGSGAALISVTNPDGSRTGLIFDVHKYLDVDNSGEHAECTTDNIADAFAVVAEFLRQNGREAMVSETGAGSTASCFTDFCAQNTFLNQNSDVFLGYIAWGAGSFSNSYVLSLTPTKQNGKFIDNALCSQCVVAPFLNAATTTIGSLGIVASTTIGILPTTISSEASNSETITASDSIVTSSALGKSIESTVTSTQNTALSTEPSKITKSSVSTQPPVTTSSSSPTTETTTPTPNQSNGGTELRRFAGAGSLDVFYCIFL